MNNKNLEIEIKFLVDKNFFDKNLYEKLKNKSVSIRQGYMSEDDKKLIRIRIIGDKGFITIKGDGFLSHKEYEYKIPLDDAYEMLTNYCDVQIHKIRYTISYKDHTWIIDQFFGDNSGLILAEIELKYENEKFEKPEWVLDEVTGLKQYYNNYLSKVPYNQWK